MFPQAHCSVTGHISCRYVAFQPDDLISISEDADLYVGTSVIGQVKKGQSYRISRIEGDWVLLKTLEGIDLEGWVSIKKIKKSD